MIAFTALSSHKNPQKVLVVGGGDGGMAKQALRFPSVQEVTVCDIDKVVVEKSKEFLPDLAKSLTHPKCKVIINDAFDHLEECKTGKYDVILCDTTDPQGCPFSERIFGAQFYRLAKNALTAEGIICTQSGANMWQHLDEQEQIIRALSTAFPTVQASYIPVPNFSCGQNSMLIASKNKDQNLRSPYWTFTNKTLDSMGILFYTTSLHRSCFHLPRFVEKTLFKLTINNSNGEIEKT